MNLIMDLDFNGWTLFWGFTFGTLGLWFIKQAKERANYGLGAIGLTLLVYPYFVANPWFCFGLGTVLCLAAYKIW